MILYIVRGCTWYGSVYEHGLINPHVSVSMLKVASGNLKKYRMINHPASMRFQKNAGSIHREI